MRLVITSSALRALADVAKPYQPPPVPARSSGRVPSRGFVWSTSGAGLVGYVGARMRVMNTARWRGRQA
jgi:hypothetical protein